RSQVVGANKAYRSTALRSKNVHRNFLAVTDRAETRGSSVFEKPSSSVDEPILLPLAKILDTSLSQTVQNSWIYLCFVCPSTHVHELAQPHARRMRHLGVLTESASQLRL